MSSFSGLFVRTKLRWFRMWLALGICLIAAVFYFSLTPVSIPAEHFDKLYHALTYALMMGWFVQLYRGRRSHLLLAIGFMSMGVSIEILQGFHPMRYFDVLDSLANAAGIAIVWIFAGGEISTGLQRFEQRFQADQSGA
jgi:hypothetical protein